MVPRLRLGEHAQVRGHQSVLQAKTSANVIRSAHKAKVQPSRAWPDRRLHLIQARRHSVEHTARP
jgi:hypothetical protein